ncbi:MAG: hypothetical protein JW915_21300 [Chitinispirillaceae bacterium]|nr:hypothetical protein [Chitinispirillaceae bacterium]
MSTINNRIVGMIKLIILSAICICGQMKSSTPDNNQIMGVKGTIDSIDSIDTEIQRYLDVNKVNTNISTIKISRKTEKIIKDTSVFKDKDTLKSKNEDSTHSFTFRDTTLESNYYNEYYTTGDPDACDSIFCITPKAGTVSNIKTGKMVYGFVNMHNRTKKVEIDFKQFDRIGIYSIFPEKYGCIEMIFSGNKTISEGKIIEVFVKQAQKYNTKVDLVVSYYNWNTLKKEGPPQIRQDVVMLNMVDSLMSMIKMHQFDGITFDFDISRMDYLDFLYYKKLLYTVHKEIKKCKTKCLNIVINTSDILDTNRYSYGKIDSLKNISDQENEKIDSRKKVYNRLNLLLKPDLINYINYLIVNADTNIQKLKYIVDYFNDKFDSENNSKLVMLLPHYNYNNIEEKAEIHKKIKEAFAEKFGLALWHIDYLDSSFYKVLNGIKYEDLNTISTPRIFIIKRFRKVRAFVDFYRFPIGVFLVCLILVFVSFITYSKMAGRETLIKNYKSVYVVTIIFLLFLSYLYIILYPFSIDKPVDLIFIGVLLVVFFIAAVYRLYETKRREDLP